MTKTIDISKLQFGQDPEFAVYHNDKPIIIADKIPGSKNNPHQLTKNISIQPDGVAVEMTVTPANSIEEFVTIAKEAFDVAQGFVKNINPEYEIRVISSAHFPMSELRKHKSCMEFGCSPSYSAYTNSAFEIPSAGSTTLRTFGAHRHIFVPAELKTDEDYDIFLMLAKCFDVTLGIPSLLVDKDDERRQLYGKAGDFRIKVVEGGAVFEYRTLGGFMNNPQYTAWTIKQLIKGVELFNNKEMLNTVLDCSETIRTTIDDKKYEYIDSILEIFNVNVPIQTESKVRT